MSEHNQHHNPENHDHHANHDPHASHDNHGPPPPSRSRLAFSFTLHCLLGCGIGEVIGIIIGTALLWTNVNTLILAVSLGFVFGFVLGMWPLLRAGFNFRKAFRAVLIAEGLSIAVMEATEVLVEVYTPGVMDAGVLSWLFAGGMLLAMTAGFIAAYPVNYILIGYGIRHIH